MFRDFGDLYSARQILCKGCTGRKFFIGNLRKEGLLCIVLETAFWQCVSRLQYKPLAQARAKVEGMAWSSVWGWRSHTGADCWGRTYVLLRRHLELGCGQDFCAAFSAVL